MAIKPCTGSSAADWITSSQLPWHQLVGFGPAGFDGHARLRFIPDPAQPGQSENDAAPGPDAPTETQQLEFAVAALRKHTTTPDELFFCFWDGFGFAMPGAQVDVPNRSYFLYRGKVSSAGTWDIAPADQAPGQPWLPVPALIWPADHAWCAASDVDPHWAGIGASSDAIAALLADGRLDVVRANPGEQQPHYRD